MTAKTNAELPDPFRFENGDRVRTVADWQERRREIRDLIVELEYGGLPPAPAATRCEVLHTSRVKCLKDARFICCRVVTGPDHAFSFLLNLLTPPGDGPFPVVLNGDACWRYATDEVAAEVLRRGYILAQFNRVEIAPDEDGSPRISGLNRVFPDARHGTLAAWAWGYHRCVDVLAGMDFVDASRIAIAGHSRGGKAVLLAGATDERIALTCANNSGAGGAGCYRWQGPESQRLADLIHDFPGWFGPGLKQFVGREKELPFDQHFLKSLIAPRCLLTTESLDDLWANPSGTWQTHLATREVYRFLGAEGRISIWYRQGVHEHGIADWRAFLDYMEWQLCGGAPRCDFDRNPYPDMPPAFSWCAPG